jgi:hypothetical protein
MLRLLFSHYCAGRSYMSLLFIQDIETFRALIYFISPGSAAYGEHTSLRFISCQLRQPASSGLYTCSRQPPACSPSIILSAWPLRFLSMLFRHTCSPQPTPSLRWAEVLRIEIDFL